LVAAQNNEVFLERVLEHGRIHGGRAVGAMQDLAGGDARVRTLVPCVVSALAHDPLVNTGLLEYFVPTVRKKRNGPAHDFEHVRQELLVATCNDGFYLTMTRRKRVWRPQTKHIAAHHFIGLVKTATLQW